MAGRGKHPDDKKAPSKGKGKKKGTTNYMWH